MTRPIIRVVAALIRNSAGEMLLVRKRDTAWFMNPGGKYELDETPPQTLVRELHEELGLVVEESALRYLGFFETDAANEAGHALEATVYGFTSDEPVTPMAEIAELRWVDPGNLGGTAVAPLVLDLVGARHAD